MPELRSSRDRLRVVYAAPAPGGASAGATVTLDVPWLAGASDDGIFRDASAVESSEGWSLYELDGLLIGHGRAPFRPGNLSGTTADFYRRMLAVVGNRHLWRVWNYVPHINAVTAGLENYRAFCQGRSQAFEGVLGRDFRRSLSAASAVGCEGDDLQVLFVAGTTPGRHIENPEQVPAYDYPPEHGPRPPSFARATLAESARRKYVFVSGTAAIKGHATVPGPLSRQLECTVDNLRLISREIDAGERLGADSPAQRHFKIYLRRAQDLAEARTFLEAALLRPTDAVSYVRADICRAALDVEIEATLVQPRS